LRGSLPVGATPAVNFGQSASKIPSNLEKRAADFAEISPINIGGHISVNKGHR
jgi:hypothetical protein